MPQAPEEFLRNTVLEKLARDEVVASMTVRLLGAAQIARIAHSAGFDTLYVDLEHNALSIGDVANICLEALGAGITPLVRVPHLGDIQRVLDAGALGVIVPHVCTAEEARAAVAATKYPPLGARGVTSALPQFRFMAPPPATAQRLLNAATMVIVMMEDVKALDDIEAIAAVEGVDVLHIGTNDLTASMGIPGDYDDPRVIDAYARTIAAARRHGKHVGTGGMTARQDKVAEVVKMGVRYVSTGADLNFLVRACTEQAAQVRKHPV